MSPDRRVRLVGGALRVALCVLLGTNLFRMTEVGMTPMLAFSTGVCLVALYVNVMGERTYRERAELFRAAKSLEETVTLARVSYTWHLWFNILWMDPYILYRRAFAVAKKST